MKILLLNGSPRQGNTWTLMENLGGKLAAHGHDIEALHLHRHRIETCRGCYQCFLKGAQCCPIRDEVPALWARLEAADAVVFGAGVYALGVPGLLKNFMDRVAWHSHRPSFYGKPALILGSAAGPGGGQLISQLRWFSILGFAMVGARAFLAYPAGRDRPRTAAAKDRALAALAARLDRRLRRDAAARRPASPGLLRLIQFQALKLNSSFGRSVYLADWEYYRDRRFYADVPLNPLKLLLAKLVFRLGWRALDAAVDRRA